MPNGQSVIGTAREMTLSVAKALRDDIHPSMVEHIKHLESRKAHLESLLRDSNQSDVREMIAELDASIDALKAAAALVLDAADKATTIEARL